jgi:hypothetical protein
MKIYWGGDTIFENGLQIEGKYENARKNFEIAEETNLYSSQINPNKPMNCTVQGTQ